MISSPQFNNPNIFYEDIPGNPELPRLTLPNLEIISYEEFSENPIFKETKEKQLIFRELVKILFLKEFREDYEIFLQDMDGENWFYPYENEPEKLAYFAIIAYLEKKISLEELFVMHMVGNAYLEKNEGVSVENVFIKTLMPNTAGPYLQRNGYYPFKIDKIKGLKSLEEIEVEKKEFLEGLEKLSFVARTCIEYSVKDFDFESVEQSIARNAVGFREVGKVATFVLLSPYRTMDLYRISSKMDVLHPSYMFGYKDDDSIFYQGVRVASIASPLFEVPYVHGNSCGPKGLGIQFHDLNYHLLIEAFNPDIPKFIKVAKGLKKIALQLENPVWKKACIKSASKVVDRDAVFYLFQEPRSALFTALARDLYRESMPIFGRNKIEFKKWFEVISNKKILPEGFTIHKVTCSIWWIYRV